MYRIEYTKRTKTFKPEMPYETSHTTNACLFQTEHYEQAIDEFRKQLESEVSYQSIIDYSLLHTLIELYDYNESTNVRKLLKTISIQNF